MGALRATSNSGVCLADGTVECTRCGRDYKVRNGVLSLLDAQALHHESAYEMAQRDAKNESIAAGARREWRSRFADSCEAQPTLDTVAVEPGMVVNELGCGTGRYTLALSERAAAVVAVDFSTAGLALLRQKLDRRANVALVQADVTQHYGAPRCFDRVLSTLHSNLPSRDHRLTSLRNVAETLTPRGRAVISMHHYSVRNLLPGTPAEGRYPDTGIYRYYLRACEAREEFATFFDRLRFVHVAVSVPGLKNVALARAAARIPLVRSGLATIFLGVAEGAHPPVRTDLGEPRLSNQSL
jgi:SAM-dependent methyltransferase